MMQRGMLSVLVLVTTVAGPSVAEDDHYLVSREGERTIALQLKIADVGDGTFAVERAVHVFVDGKLGFSTSPEALCDAALALAHGNDLGVGLPESAALDDGHDGNDDDGNDGTLGHDALAECVRAANEATTHTRTGATGANRRAPGHAVAHPARAAHRETTLARRRFDRALPEARSTGRDARDGRDEATGDEEDDDVGALEDGNGDEED